MQRIWLCLLLALSPTLAVWRPGNLGLPAKSAKPPDKPDSMEEAGGIGLFNRMERLWSASPPRPPPPRKMGAHLPSNDDIRALRTQGQRQQEQQPSSVSSAEVAQQERAAYSEAGATAMVSSGLESLEILNQNQGPWLPPAQKYVRLGYERDSLVYTLRMTAGSDPQDEPLDSEVYVAIDTGSGDLMLRNASSCARPEHCYNVRDSASWAYPSRGHTWQLEVDGEILFDGACVLGEETLWLPVRWVGTEPYEYLTTRASVLVSSKLEIYGGSHSLHDGFDAAGVLGVSYDTLSRSPGGSAFTKLFAAESDIPGRPVFALDLEDGIGRLDVGGIDESYRDKLVWSESYYKNFGDATYHMLSIHDLSICGIPLLQDIAPYWDALIDTGAACLSLPQEIFDIVVTWIPVRQTGATLPTQRHGAHTVLHVPADVVKILPTLNFRLRKDGPMLYLPLEALLLDPDSSGSERLCLHRGRSVYDSWGVISFGSMALRPFYAVLSMLHQQVALANKHAFNESRIQCLTRQVCKGMQTHYEPMNMCTDPDCSAHYFFEIDHETKTCHLSSAFHITAIVLIVTVVLVDLALNEAYHRITDKVYATVDPL